ncbi:MAG: response regulator [Lachnospiraceae bacterium]|nr:response regulator [Lachnospiraceae bacterium]
MIKVFLVEDEFIIREGIKNNIDWQDNGLEFCGEAGDGELAFPMIRKEKPDIVITDIKMPFMDGLSLSRLIKKELPDTEIIILSGYEEFEYAKEAIRIGVSEYLLKPVSGDELLKAVKEISGRIEERKREQELYARYIHETEQWDTKEKRELFDDMITGIRSYNELVQEAEQLGIDITAMFYNILLIKISSTRHAENEFSGSIVKIESALDELCIRYNAISFDRALEGKAILFKADTAQELEEAQTAFIDEAQKLFSDYHHIRYFGGKGTPVQRLSDIPSAYETASRAFANRYLTEGSMILSGDKTDSKRPEDSFDLGKVSPEQIDRNRVKDFLKFGEREEIRFFVGEYFNSLGGGAVRSTIFRQYIAMDIYFCVAEFVESLMQPRDGIETIQADSLILQNEENTAAYACRILEQAIEIRDSIASNRYGSIVESVEKLIEENYSDDELTVSSIAAKVNFSPNHLSMVFRNQTGQTLIKYLTDYRLNKAKELLKCSSLRSSEIAQQCGYKDPHYFSYLFKKTVGMTPTQYRGGDA